MNRIKTFEGGQPFTTGDLDFLQDSIKDVINALIAALSTSQDCILTGILEEGSRSSAVPGALYIKGNIYILKNNTPAVSGTSYHLCIRQDESGSRFFRDGQEHKVYIVDNSYMSDIPSETSVDLRTVTTIHEELILKNGMFYDLGVSFPANVTGNIRHVKSGMRSVDGNMIVNIMKSVETDTNVLWSNGNRDVYMYSAIVVQDRKVYIVEGNIMEGRIYNLDGTEYNGPISLINLKLK